MHYVHTDQSGIIEYINRIFETTIYNYEQINENKTLVPEERIASKILFIRGEKIILDFHLADLYGTETRALKQAVKRNIERFPIDFMFELTEDEPSMTVNLDTHTNDYIHGCSI